MTKGGVPEVGPPDDVAVPERRGTGLALRLMVAMGMALLPLAVLTYRQAVETEQISGSRARAAILGDTMVAASPQIERILRGGGLAAGLAFAVPQLMADPAGCTKALAKAKADSAGAYLYISYLTTSGDVICSSDGEKRNFSGSRFLAKWLKDPQAVVDVNMDAPVSGVPIVIFAHPVRNAEDTVTGFVTISAPHTGFFGAGAEDAQTDTRPLKPAAIPHLALVTFDAEGTVLTSSLGLDKTHDILPSNRSLAKLAGEYKQSFISSTASGQKRAFAVVPLAAGKLFLLGSWPSDRLEFGPFIAKMPAFLFPFLMWAASLLVAWIATEALVIRHVRSLRKSITTFARGDRKVLPLHFEGAANELRDVGDAYVAMTAAILHDEADLENTIHQKEVLLREVHHRVKNNLQLIASILNMQLRNVRSPEARDAMRNVQERVMSLATIHRELYQTSGLTDVRADELLPQIVSQILRIGSAPGRRFNVSTDIEPLRLTPDQAVPLSLFLTEGMANAMKHGASIADGGGKLRVGLQMGADGRAHFALTNQIAPDSQTETQKSDAIGITGISDGFGSQLLTAFASQLDASLDQGRFGDDFTLSLTFPVRPLTDAEERAAARNSDEALSQSHGEA